METLTHRLLGSLSHRKPVRPPAIPPSNLQSSDLLPYSEEYLRFLADMLPEIVWTALPDGTHDYMNKRWFEYTGLTEEETYGESKTIVHPDDFDLYKAKWKEAIRTGKQYEMAYRFRRASDGVYRWHIGRALPLKDEHGHIVKWFGTCVDIHAQKEAEEQIRHMNEDLELTVLERTKYLRKEIRQRRRAEEKYLAHLQLLHSMIDMFPMAACVVDSRNTLLHANERFYTFFHLTKNALTEHPPIVGLLHRRFPEEALKFEQNISRNEFFRQEMIAEGRTYLLEYHPTVEGPIESGYLLLVRDISQEKKIDRAKSEFMSLASHQLRTPLTSMRWALGRLSRALRGKLNAEEWELMKRARSATMSMADTITTMLSISRIEAGLHTVNESRVHLKEFLEKITEENMDSIQMKRISFAMDVSPVLEVRTDPAMLREIIHNLLTNAIKYTPEGGSISMRAERTDGHVLLHVRDSGRGIPEHQQKNVFSKFFRGDNITKVDTEGTGLGLYLVSHLVESIGGTITFVSQEGQGTEFTLRLPVERE